MTGGDGQRHGKLPRLGEQAMTTSRWTGRLQQAALASMLGLVLLGTGAPDSARAYAAATADDNVGVIDLKTLNLVDRIKTGTGPDGMAWVASPDPACASRPSTWPW